MIKKRILGLIVSSTLATLVSTESIASGIKLDNIPICHGFGCSQLESVSITDAEWGEITAFFNTPAETPEQERDQIRRATGWMEIIMGRYTPIHVDKGTNDFPDRYKVERLSRDDYKLFANYSGQMDCIDESKNMTTYLNILQENNLFKHHKVVERAHRSTLRDQHYAGQIQEHDAGTKWVIDSWFYDFGILPYIEESKEWHDLPYFFSSSFGHQEGTEE